MDLTICEKTDCRGNYSGVCKIVKRETRLKNGTKHTMNIEQCPFYMTQAMFLEDQEKVKAILIEKGKQDLIDYYWNVAQR